MSRSFRRGRCAIVVPSRNRATPMTVNRKDAVARVDCGGGPGIRASVGKCK